MQQYVQGHKSMNIHSKLYKKDAKVFKKFLENENYTEIYITFGRVTFGHATC